MADTSAGFSGSRVTDVFLRWARSSVVPALAAMALAPQPAQAAFGQPLMSRPTCNATAIVAAGSHTCARLADASVQCWGANASGQLGNGSTQPASGKVVVRNLGATTIEAGLDHTCAMVVDGTIRCWGHGGEGRLGNGSTANQPTRVQVTPFP